MFHSTLNPFAKPFVPAALKVFHFHLELCHLYRSLESIIPLLTAFNFTEMISILHIARIISSNPIED